MVHFATRGGDKRVLAYIAKASSAVTKSEIRRALAAFISADGVNISLSSLMHKELICEVNYKYKLTALGEEKHKQIQMRTDHAAAQES